MPKYLYRCRSCGKEHERVQRLKDPDLKRCPEIGCKGEVFKVIQPVSINFVGSGFYVNDYSRQ